MTTEGHFLDCPVLAGEMYWGLCGGAWGLQAGTLATQMLSASSTAVLAGFYATTTLDAVDTDLAAGNIATGVNLFGVAGTLQGGCSCSGALSLGGRWCTNGDGTVTDLNNCLVWLQASDCAGDAPWVEPATGAPAGAHTKASNLVSGTCELTDGSTEGDWRLPTRNELGVLVNGTERVRTGTPGPFTGVVSA